MYVFVWGLLRRPQSKNSNEPRPQDPGVHHPPLVRNGRVMNCFLMNTCKDLYLFANTSASIVMLFLQLDSFYFPRMHYVILFVIDV